MAILAAFVACCVLAAVNQLVGTSAVRGFLSRTPAMATRVDLGEYKELVRRQMYQALLQIVLLLAAAAVGAVGLFTHKLSLLFVLAGNGAIIALGLAGKRLEERARSLPVRDPSLSDEYQRVSASWVTRPLPDF